MTIKLHELLAEKAAIVAQMQEIHKSDETEEGMTDEQVAQFEALTKSLKKISAKIARKEEMTAADAEDAKAASKSDEDEDEDKDEDDKDEDEKSSKSFVGNLRPFSKGMTVPAAPKATMAPGKLALAALVAKAYDMLPPEYAADRRYANASEMLRKEYGEAVYKTLQATGTGPNGGYALPTSYLADLIPYLRSQTVMRQIGCRNIPVPTGNLTIPRQSATMTAVWQGEMDEMTVSNLQLDDIVLLVKRLTGLSTVTNQLIAQSPLAVEDTIRNDLAMQIARAEDLSFLRGPGTGGQPLGLLGFATAANAVNTATAKDPDSVNAYLTHAKNVLDAANQGEEGRVWIMHPSVRNYIWSLRNSFGQRYFPEVESGMLFAYPLKTTTQLPTNLTTYGGTHGAEIFLVKASECIIADGLMPTISVSQEATVQEGGVARNAFTQDFTVFKMVERVDFNMNHTSGVTVIGTDGWLP